MKRDSFVKQVNVKCLQGWLFDIAHFVVSQKFALRGLFGIAHVGLQKVFFVEITSSVTSRQYKHLHLHVPIVSSKKI